MVKVSPRISQPLQTELKVYQNLLRIAFWTKTCKLKQLALFFRIIWVGQLETNIEKSFLTLNCLQQATTVSCECFYIKESVQPWRPEFSREILRSVAMTQSTIIMCKTLTLLTICKNLDIVHFTNRNNRKRRNC